MAICLLLFMLNGLAERRLRYYSEKLGKTYS